MNKSLLFAYCIPFLEDLKKRDEKQRCCCYLTHFAVHVITEKPIIVAIVLFPVNFLLYLFNPNIDINKPLFQANNYKKSVVIKLFAYLILMLKTYDNGVHCTNKCFCWSIWSILKLIKIGKNYDRIPF